MVVVVCQRSLFLLRGSGWSNNLVPDLRQPHIARKKGTSRNNYTAHLNASSPSLLSVGEESIGEGGLPLHRSLRLFKLGLHLQPSVCGPRTLSCSPFPWSASAKLGIVLHPLLPPSGLGYGCHLQPPQPSAPSCLFTFIHSLDKGSFPEATQVSWERDVKFLERFGCRTSKSCVPITPGSLFLTNI